MIPVIQNLPHDFNRSGQNPELKNSKDPAGSYRENIPAIPSNVGATVAKFNDAFRELLDCEITNINRDMLATMKRYAHLMRRDDIANELEYHLSRPVDGDISCVVPTRKIGRF